MQHGSMRWKRGAEKIGEGVAVGAGVKLASRLLAAGAASAAITAVATIHGTGGMHVSAKGIALIERNEGERHYPYQDPSGIPACTVGAGHVLAWAYCTRAQLGTYYSQAAIDRLLASDARKAESCVPATTQPAFDALVDLTLNAGCGSIGWHTRPYYRTIYSLVQAGELALAAAEVRNTAVTAGGNYLAGLQARRDREAALMLTGYYGAGIGYYVAPRVGFWCRRYRYSWSTCVAATPQR
jgi:GH24 family phage-related lysozyme (muramidase)